MTAPPSRPGSGTARCGVEEGCLHFLRHRREAIDATRHHGSVRSPNRHQRRAGWLGLHGDVQEQDEVGSPGTRRCAAAAGLSDQFVEFNPAAPRPRSLITRTTLALRPRPRPGPSPQRHRRPRGASAPWRGTGAGGAGCRGAARCRSSAPRRSSGRRAF